MPMEREAIIRKIRFPKNGVPNPSNPWVIVETDDPEFPSWKGVIAVNADGEFNPDFGPGTWVRAEGVPGQKEGKYSAPFVVQRVIQAESEKPDFGKAWMIWRLPEIGEARASQISERFGRSLPEFFNDKVEAQRVLSTISGLTAKRVAKIQEAYRDHRGELGLALQMGQPDPGLRAGFHWPAIKIALEYYEENFQERGVHQLREDLAEDPYELMAIDGITYSTVDSYAEGVGIVENDPRRLRAMVWERLDNLLGGKGLPREQRHLSGSTFEPMDRLMRMERLAGSQAAVVDILSQSKHFELNRFGAQLSEIVWAESAFAAKAQDLVSASQQSELPMSVGLPDWLDESQRAAVENLLTVSLAILTGGPGTGKTTVLKSALDQMERRGERVALASPTGKAAKRMTETTGRPAKTIHKLLEWKPDGFDRDASNPIDSDVIVIDESSMLDIEIGAHLMEAVATGTRLIFVGDVNQLPPVGPGQPLLDLMKSGIAPTFRLTQTHRQKADSWVIDNAYRILEGKLPSLRNQSDFQFVNLRDPQRIVEVVIAMYRDARAQGVQAEKQLQVLTSTNLMVNLLNSEVQRTMNPNASDSRFADDFVQGVGESKIFAGDKVFYTKNNAELGLVNGSMGTVQEIEVLGDRRIARVQFDGESNPAREQFEDETNPDTGNDIFELVDADIRPLTLAYAMTIHKSQGSEWSNVVVVCAEGQWMTRKLLYTAITRTNDHLTILGTEVAVNNAVRSNPDESRMTLLQQRLRGEL
jgi:exodeoxyribonuclease V alpha subunit